MYLTISLPLGIHFFNNKVYVFFRNSLLFINLQNQAKKPPLKFLNKILNNFSNVIYKSLIFSRRMKWKKENKTKLDGGEGLEDSGDEDH